MGGLGDAFISRTRHWEVFVVGAERGKRGLTTDKRRALHQRVWVLVLYFFRSLEYGFVGAKACRFIIGALVALSIAPRHLRKKASE